MVDMSDLEIRDEFQVKCPNCEIPLAEVIVTNPRDDEKDIPTRFKAENCYNCGGDSFYTKVYKGRPYIKTANDDVIIDMVDTDAEFEGVGLNQKVVRVTCIFTTRKKKKKTNG